MSKKKDKREEFKEEERMKSLEEFGYEIPFLDHVPPKKWLPLVSNPRSTWKRPAQLAEMYAKGEKSLSWMKIIIRSRSNAEYRDEIIKQVELKTGERVEI